MKKVISLLLFCLSIVSCVSKNAIVNNTFNNSTYEERNEVIQSNNNTSLVVEEKTKSKYEKPKITDGLFYGAVLFGNDNVALVISFNNKPIPPKSNEPDSQTLPGFYPTGREQFTFAEIKVIRNQVYFKTNSINGLRYEFTGKTGKDFDKELDTFVPFITGVITELKDDKPHRNQKITFGHAVVY